MTNIDYSKFEPGDFILVSNTNAWTSYRVGVITKVKSHSVDAVIFLDGGLEYRADIWHEDDERVGVVRPGVNITRGVFREAPITKAIKEIPKLQARIDQITDRLHALAELIRGYKASISENRRGMDREARSGQRE
ncbi:MAG: hypothetical protein RML36_15325 [Anaerolineae bacterium]|nr:hypothetical protein [Anaerolineae bacterium]